MKGESRGEPQDADHEHLSDESERVCWKRPEPLP